MNALTRDGFDITTAGEDIFINWEHRLGEERITIHYELVDELIKRLYEAKKEILHFRDNDIPDE